MINSNHFSKSFVAPGDLSFQNKLKSAIIIPPIYIPIKEKIAAFFLGIFAAKKVAVK